MLSRFNFKKRSKLQPAPQDDIQSVQCLPRASKPRLSFRPHAKQKASGRDTPTATPTFSPQSSRSITPVPIMYIYDHASVVLTRQGGQRVEFEAQPGSDPSTSTPPLGSLGDFRSSMIMVRKSVISSFGASTDQILNWKADLSKRFSVLRSADERRGGRESTFYSIAGIFDPQTCVNFNKDLVPS